MRRFHYFILLLIGINLSAQDSFDVLFYNVENLFDCNDDTLKNDAEFLPEGDRRWNHFRYKEKRTNLGKAIISAGQWGSPVLIGLCEIENQTVLNDLIYGSPLKELAYSYIHRESNDARGIDVALLYRRSNFKPVFTHFFPHPTIPSRDILYVCGLYSRKDTFHVFVNHWPSRYRGAVLSDPLRKASADVLRQKVDSIYRQNANANIIIMGDFNDYSKDESLYKHLGAKEDGDLVNLALLSDKSLGSYKHQGRWDYLDQFIVSKSLVSGINHWRVMPLKQMVHRPDFLLEEDKAYTGVKPKRSWIGFQYQSGFSDHLPVLLHLQKD